MVVKRSWLRASLEGRARQLGGKKHNEGEGCLVMRSPPVL